MTIEFPYDFPFYFDPVEDATTYSKVGQWRQWGIAGNPLNLEITKRKVEFYACKNGSTYLYSDKGIDYFTDFTHYVDVTASSGEDSSEAYVWLLSNAVNNVRQLKDNSENYIGVYFGYSGSTLSLVLVECNAGTLYSTSYTATLGTKYYLKIIKSGTSLSCEIYSDAERTSLITTLSITLQSNYSFRYIYMANTWFTNPNDLKLLKVIIEDLRI